MCLCIFCWVWLKSHRKALNWVVSVICVRSPASCWNSASCQAALRLSALVSSWRSDSSWNLEDCFSSKGRTVLYFFSDSDCRVGWAGVPQSVQLLVRRHKPDAEDWRNYYCQTWFVLSCSDRKTKITNFQKMG